MSKLIFQPLALAEIALLLRQAKAAALVGNQRELIRCYNLLENGIAGLTCPYPVDGLIADVIEHLDDLLCDWTTFAVTGAGPAVECFAQTVLQSMQSPLRAGEGDRS